MPKSKQTEAAKRGWKKQKREGRNAVKVCSSSIDRPKRRKLRDNESMVMAIEAVKEGKMGVNQATREHGVPCIYNFERQTFW